MTQTAKKGRPSTAGLKAALEREQQWRERVQQRVRAIEKLPRVPTARDMRGALMALMAALTED